MLCISEGGSGSVVGKNVYIVRIIHTSKCYFTKLMPINVTCFIQSRYTHIHNIMYTNIIIYKYISCDQ